MKKVLVICCVLLVFVLTACGGEKDLYLPEAEGDTMYTAVGEFGGL